MSSEWRVLGDGTNAYTHTGHYSPVDEHALHVWHTHGDGADDLTVDLKFPPTVDQRRRGVANHTVFLHHDRPNDETWVGAGDPWMQPHEGTRVAAPSPELQTLIEAHHENQAWMPLLDKLVEEYPEHFTRAVEAHTVARQQQPKPRPPLGGLREGPDEISEDTAHYARAFAESQRQ